MKGPYVPMPNEPRPLQPWLRMQAMIGMTNMSLTFKSTILRALVCVIASFSLQACATAPEIVSAEVVTSKAMEISRAQGANPTSYDTTVRLLLRRAKNELDGLTDKEIDDVITLAPDSPVWVVVMRLKSGPGVRGWSFIYLFSADKGEILKDYMY